MIYFRRSNFFHANQSNNQLDILPSYALPDDALFLILSQLCVYSQSDVAVTGYHLKMQNNQLLQFTLINYFLDFSGDISPISIMWERSCAYFINICGELSIFKMLRINTLKVIPVFKFDSI